MGATVYQMSMDPNSQFYSSELKNAKLYAGKLKI